MPPSETEARRTKTPISYKIRSLKNSPSYTFPNYAQQYKQPKFMNWGYFFLCCQSPSQSLLLTRALIRRQMACGFKISHWMYTCTHESIFLCTIAHVCCLVQWTSAGKFLKFLHQSLCHLLAIIPAVCSSSITPLAFHHEVLPLPEFLPWSSTSSFKSLSSSKETDPPPVVLPGLWQPDFVPSSYL